jgi:hypothetical protein
MLAVALCALAVLGFSAPAGAAPGAFRVLIVHATAPPTKLQQQIAAEPEVASVELFDAESGVGGATPAAAQLAAYDLVVSISNDTYADHAAYGNALADFVDSGGVVVQFAYDNWYDGGALNGPTGRFASGGYEPFIPGENPNALLALGSFDAASPLMQGVSELSAVDNTEPTLAPGAALVASWANGVPLVAQKGRVVSVSAYPGDEDFWSGQFGRLAANAVRFLGKKPLTVTKKNPAGGTVTASLGGLLCGGVCSTVLTYQTQVLLVAAAKKGFAFSGFSGACAGRACALTMDGPKAVTAGFVSFRPRKKVKLDEEKGTGLLAVQVGAPGRVTLLGTKVKRRSKALSKAGKVVLPVIAEGAAAEALGSSGKVKVKFRVIFTPTGGIASVVAKKVQLKLASD